jgi:parallel beta-helix repeat protein
MKLQYIFTGLLLSMVGLPSWSNESSPPSNVPKVLVNGGLRFQSEGGGTPNTLSGYIFVPLSQTDNGNVLFVDGFANLNFGGDSSDESFGASTRLGYRWLNDDRSWLLGANAGLDTTPYQGDYNWQAGLGLEALNKNVEIRANGYIPLSNSNKETGRGYSSANLSNNSLNLIGAYQDWITSYGGFDLEAGTPVARWEQGGLWLYAGYYYLDSTVSNGPATSGISARAEARIANNFAVGATYSYDDIFQSKATGYIRYGSQPQTRDTAAEISRAEIDLLAQRGLPVEREIDVRISEVRIQGTQIAQNPDTNNAWVIRCVGTNASGNNCEYNSLAAAVRAGSSDVILVADGNSTNLGGSSLAIPEGAVLSNGINAPVLDTQYGNVDLSDIYGTGDINSRPTISNGTLTVASDSAIEGFNFTNATITNRSTSNVSIKDNTFTGSFTGEGAIVFDGATDVVIANNTITNPNLSLLKGSSVDTFIGRGIAVKNGDNIRITGNTVKGATGEGIYIENIGTSADNIITGNTVSGMKASEDSNLEAGIFVRNNKDGYIAITGNTVKDNNLDSGVGFPAERGTNATDGIEVNSCRGGDNLGGDAFTDGVAGACANNATLTAVISQNIVSNLQGGADGIDANIGDNGRLNLTVDKNTVTGAGDEGFTLDAFGANTQATVVITDNTLKTSGAKGAAPGEDGSTDGIAITLQENVSDTDFTGSGVYNFTITGNTIEADTDNLAGTIERADKAEGIKFTINEGLKNGTTKVTALIEANTITTRIGDGIEFAVNEKAGEGVVFDADITINDNRIIQTNDNPVGSDNKDPRDLIKGTFGEEAEGSITTGIFTITNNTLTSAAGAGDAFDYESLSTSDENSFKFKIEANNFTATDDKDLKIAVPSGFLGIFAPDGTTDFDAYLDSVNTGAETEITGSPQVFRF